MNRKFALLSVNQLKNKTVPPIKIINNPIINSESISQDFEWQKNQDKHNQTKHSLPSTPTTPHSQQEKNQNFFSRLIAIRFYPTKNQILQITTFRIKTKMKARLQKINSEKCLPITLNEQTLPTVQCVRYLSITIDRRHLFRR